MVKNKMEDEFVLYGIEINVVLVYFRKYLIMVVEYNVEYLNIF